METTPISLFLIILYLIIAIPASWRLTSLIQIEDGPWNIFRKFRRIIGVKEDDDEANFITKLFACVDCFSVWIGALFCALYFAPLWLVGPPIMILNLSAGIIWFNNKVDK